MVTLTYMQYIHERTTVWTRILFSLSLIPLYTQMNKNIVIIFSKQNLFNLKRDKSTGIKISTKLHYSLWDKYRADWHDLKNKKYISCTENTINILEIWSNSETNVLRVLTRYLKMRIAYSEARQWCLWNSTYIWYSLTVVKINRSQ